MRRQLAIAELVVRRAGAHMNDEDGSRRQRCPAHPPARELLLEALDWEKIRTAVYRITAQVKAVKDVEQAVRTQLLTMDESEWAAAPDLQGLALGVAYSAASRWLVENLNWNGLQAYMYALTGRVAGVDEITQTVKDKLLKIPPGKWDDIQDRRKYINTLVRNAAADWRRREETQQYAAARRLKQAFVEDHDPVDVASLACAKRDVANLLKRLRPRVRQAFVLRKAWEYPLREIAERMGIAEQTVKSYLAEAAAVFSELEERQEGRRPRKRIASWFRRKELKS